jgi:hypothetical protein
MQAEPELRAPATAPHPRPRSEAQRSEAQRAAARRNGARSKGPVTAEGRARSARNALRHGLCSATALAPGEDPAAFAALLSELRAEHRPRTVSEALLVERLALTFWKLARCDRLEATLATIEPHCPTGRLFPDPGLPRVLSRVPELNALLRHQAQLTRELHRLLRTLAARPEPAVSHETEPGDPTPPDEPAPLDEIPQNEPEPAPPAEAPQPEAAPPAEAPTLLEQARTDPTLAQAIQAQLLANGDLEGYARACRELRAGGGLSVETAPGPGGTT